MGNYLTKAELSKLVNVSRAAITLACKGALTEAYDGKKINVDHPVAIKYIKKKSEQQSIKKDKNLTKKTIEIEHIEEEKKTPSKEPKQYQFVEIDNIEIEEKSEPKLNGGLAHKFNKKNDSLDNQKDIIKVPDNLEVFADYTLRELIQQFGTDIAFCDWLKASKLIEDINEKRIKNAATKDKLVSKELVKIGILDPINSAHTRLLTDGSKTIVKRTIAKHEAGSNLQELEVFVSDQISSYFKAMKQTIKRTLKRVE